MHGLSYLLPFSPHNKRAPDDVWALIAFRCLDVWALIAFSAAVVPPAINVCRVHSYELWKLCTGVLTKCFTCQLCRALFFQPWSSISRYQLHNVQSSFLPALKQLLNNFRHVFFSVVSLFYGICVLQKLSKSVVFHSYLHGLSNTCIIDHTMHL